MGLFSFLDRWAEEAKVNAEKRKLEAIKIKEKRDDEVYSQRLAESYELDKPQLLRIIAESISIIENTKNLKTALGRFDTLRHMYGRLLFRNPERTPIDILIGKWVTSHDITTHVEIIENVERAKNDYIREFFKTRVHMELLKADSLLDVKLKKSQLKKAMKAALDGLVYLPTDAEIKKLITTIETQITAI